MGINGFVGGVEEALFWCFVRMDIKSRFLDLHNFTDIFRCLRRTYFAGLDPNPSQSLGLKGEH